MTLPKLVSDASHLASNNITSRIHVRRDNCSSNHVSRFSHGRYMADKPVEAHLAQKSVVAGPAVSRLGAMNIYRLYIVKHFQ